MSAPPRGFTLLELVVSLAIFTLVAAMGLQAVTGTLHQNRVLDQSQADMVEIQRLMTQLRRDLDAAVPVPFTTPLGDQEPAYQAEEGRLRLSLGGQMRLTESRDSLDAGFARVIWTHDAAAGTLTRQVWPVLAPRDPDQIGPARVMLSGVTGLTVTASDAQGPAALPRQIAVRIDTERHGRLDVVGAP